ncbi:MAG: porin family protein [Hymenobacter sp.]
MLPCHAFHFHYAPATFIKIFPLLLGLLATLAAHAQQGVFRYGVKGGFSLSTYEGQLDGPYPVGHKPGFAAGALATYGLSDHAAVQLEVLYSQKGVFVDNYTYSIRTAQANFNYRRYRATLSYLDVPVLLKLNSGEANRGFYLEAGPQVSFALGQREYLSPFGKSSNAPNPEDITISTDRGALVPVVLGYVGGVGYQFGGGLGLGLRYTGDISHVYRDEAGPGSSGATLNDNAHNSTFQLQARYLFSQKN